jgi:hypothetical protein
MIQEHILILHLGVCFGCRSVAEGEVNGMCMCMVLGCRTNKRLTDYRDLGPPPLEVLALNPQLCQMFLR